MKTPQSRFKTLFLCTGNSARSILAEYLLRKAGKDRFEVFRAGVNPKGTPHPIALAILRDNFQIDTSNARSKSVDEFKDIEFDFVITVCDNAREACPVWPGRPIVAHWASPDPSTIEGDESAVSDAFWQVAQQINRRVELLVALPFEKQRDVSNRRAFLINDPQIDNLHGPKVGKLDADASGFFTSDLILFSGLAPILCECRRNYIAGDIGRLRYRPR